MKDKIFDLELRGIEEFEDERFGLSRINSVQTRSLDEVVLDCASVAADGILVR